MESSRRCRCVVFVVLALCARGTTALANCTPLAPTTACVDTTYAQPAVPPGNRIIVSAGGDLQAAINQAALGDIIELQAGATFTGHFSLPAKTGSGWIYIQSSGYASLPTPGTRVSPSDAGSMARIITPDYQAAIWAAQAASHYRFVGIEITDTNLGATVINGLVELNGATQLSGPWPTNDANVPTYIIFDRCYIHADPASNTKRGVFMNGKSMAVIDSYLSDFHSEGQDNQAIAGMNGAGPFKIVNNFLEAASENVIFGGGDPAISGLVSADIEIRSNYSYKPLSWQNNGHAWNVKNLLELKNARRVLIEGNVFENNWVDAQSGWGVLFTPRNQDGTCTWCTVEDVTFQLNILHNSPNGFQIAGTDDGDQRGLPYYSAEAARITLLNNLVYDVPGYDFLLENVRSPNYPNPPGGIINLTIDHNTMRTGTGWMELGDDGDTVNHHQSPIIRNNLNQYGLYGIHGPATGEGYAALNGYTTNYTFAKNVIIGAPSGPYSPDDCSPASTCFPASDAQVGFVDAGNNNYRLSASSPYKGAGTDGKDLGADFDALDAATAGAVSGVWSGGGLPSGYSSQDVGTTGQPGSATYSAGVFTVSGAGAAIWNSADSFHFVDEAINGDTTIIARVTSLQNTNTFAKAGIMIRESTAANAANVVLDIRPTGDFEFMTRSSTGANEVFIATANQALPAWMKLVRSGSTVTASVSTDGVTWTTLGSTTFNIAANALAGLIVCAADTTQLNTSTFDHVSITSPSGNIVIYASDLPASARHGSWTVASDGSSPNGTKLATPDNGVANTDAPLANPIDYVDVRFSAKANTPYTLWLRVQALANSKFNDSLWVQFSDAQVSGASAYPINSTSGLLVNLATDTTGSSDQGWGWVNGAYWLTQPATVTFPTTGPHTLRIQVREDGVEVDQIVLSPVTYFNSSASCPTTCNSAPGPVSNDATIVSKPAMAGQPFTGTAFAVPGTFQAEAFDLGGEGVAYHDNVAGNAGGQYRTSEDVDIIAATGNATGYVVNNFETGEWVDYTINASTAGSYTMQLHVSSEFANSAFHLEIDGVDATGTIAVPNTGSWSSFQSVSVSGLNLTAGAHLLRVVTDQQYFNFDSVTISQP